MKEKSQSKNLKKSRPTTVKEFLNNGTFEAFLAINIWLLPIMAFVIYSLSSMFIINKNIRLILCFPLSIFPWKELLNKLYEGRSKHLRTQLLVLFQVLCTSVSSGYSMEKSLTMARPVLEHTFGKKCPLIKPLIQLENDLSIHIGLEKALNNFALNIKFPQTIPIFHALGISGKIGNSSLTILRSSCQMLSDLNAVQNEINANNAGKNAEALILCLMPFAITFSLNQMSGEFIAEAQQNTKGAILLGVAFVICIITVALLLKFMSHSEKKLKESSKTQNIEIKKYRLTSIIQKVLPTSFITNRHNTFNELYFDAGKAYELYLRKLLKVSVSGFLIVALILYSTNRNVMFAILAFPVLAFLLNRDLNSELELKREKLMRNLPLFICLITTLLEAGLQLPKAINICAKAFDKDSAISDEINNLRAQILSGKSASDSVEQMSIHIQIPEAQAAFLLIARYGRLGSSEVLNLLSVQSSSCWNLCRNAARKKQERESLALLFPMTLDFVAVLLVAITPAIISLGL